MHSAPEIRQPVTPTSVRWLDAEASHASSKLLKPNQDLQDSRSTRVFVQQVRRWLFWDTLEAP